MTQRTTLLAFSLASAVNLLAQPVIQSSDVGNATLQLGIVFGATNAFADGANVTWNLTSTPFQILGTSTLGPAAGTPYAAQFPTGTRSVRNTVVGLGTYYDYWRITSSGLEVLGAGIGSGQDNVYTDPEQLLAFPFSYQGSFSDYYEIPDVNSGDVIWTYSGYGTLVTSAGTFTNVIKVKDQWDERAIFWNRSPLYPILDIDMDGDGEVRVPSSVGMEESMAKLTIRCMPNPAADMLLVTGTEAGQRYTVLDGLGRTVVAEQLVSATAPLSVDLSGLPAAAYFLRVTSDQASATVPFMKL